MRHGARQADVKAWITEHCDAETLAHLFRVGTLSADLARHLGLSAEEQHDAGLAGLLHDVGKLDLPPTVLCKAGPLDPVEERAVRRHPERGAAWLAPLVDPAVAEAVRHHHERVDGCGYPDRVPAGLLPVVSRLVPVVDAYDVMTCGRPYCRPRSREQAFEELRLVAGHQLDADLVEALIDLETSRTELRAA